jgi:phosphoadenosine phosphosulfate reductase
MQNQSAEMETVIKVSEKILQMKVDKALRIISYTLTNYEKVALACSFGKDSMTVLHLTRQIDSDIKTFCITTPFKPPQIDAFRKRMVKEWDLNLEVLLQSDDIGAGNNELWKTDPDKCCNYFKVGPTRQAVSTLNAWICGLRWDEGPSRTNYRYFETRNGLTKVNPILDFTEDDIWLYHTINSIPSNPLYEEGYRSLGCLPCSAPFGDSERAGRWAGTSKQGGECGIHTLGLR